MGWRDHLQSEVVRATFPWLGGRKIHAPERTWTIEGDLPREFGWYQFDLGAGRSAFFVGPSEPDINYDERRHLTRGYVVGNRLIPDLARVDTDPDKFIEATVPIFLVEPGLDRFPLVQAAFDRESRVIFVRQLLDRGPEEDVRRAFIDRESSVSGIKNVTPPLELAFLFATKQRELLEKRRAEFEKERLKRERLEQARKNMGTGLGRRVLAAQDFNAAAKAALAISGAEFLDARPGRTRKEMVVQYRFQNLRLECVAEKDTLRILDSGICLTSHDTGEKGDTYFTLESLPAVVGQAIREHKLVVYRHADGDEPDDDW